LEYQEEMKANYREMAKELSEIMHEQVRAEINFTYQHSECSCNVYPLGKVYVMLCTEGLSVFFSVGV